LNKVEYRAIKGQDQEIDYIIRYHPGLGAKESTDRIQSLIRQKKHRIKQPADHLASSEALKPKQGIPDLTQPSQHDIIRAVWKNSEKFNNASLCSSQYLGQLRCQSDL
jgi:hypothetical protein